MKPVTLKASEGRLLLVCRAGKGSPDLQILAGNSQQLDYVLNRSGQTQDYGPDRKWNNLLYDGGTVFEAGVPPLLRIVRDVEDERMQLYSPEGALLADVDRVVKGHGYNYPDIRHRFSWKGRRYLLEARKVFSGKNFTCTDEATSQVVLSFETTLKTFFRARQVGQVVISGKVPPEDQHVILAAWLSFYEWDGRRSLLTFGDNWLTQDVVA